jgi:hypothetical protein
LDWGWIGIQRAPISKGSALALHHHSSGQGGIVIIPDGASVNQFWCSPSECRRLVSRRAKGQSGSDRDALERAGRIRICQIAVNIPYRAGARVAGFIVAPWTPSAPNPKFAHIVRQMRPRTSSADELRNRTTSRAEPRSARSCALPGRCRCNRRSPAAETCS